MWKGVHVINIELEQSLPSLCISDTVLITLVHIYSSGGAGSIDTGGYQCSGYIHEETYPYMWNHSSDRHWNHICSVWRMIHLQGMAQFSLHTLSHSLNKTFSSYALIVHGKVLNMGIFINHALYIKDTFCTSLSFPLFICVSPFYPRHLMSTAMPYIHTWLFGCKLWKHM